MCSYESCAHNLLILKPLLRPDNGCQWFTCSMYHQYTSLINAVLSHIGSVHAHQANFRVVCGIQECPRTYTIHCCQCFVKNTDILVFNVDKCYFIIQEYETEYFSKHYHSYEVKMKNPSLFHAYQPNKLADYHPLCSYTIMGSLKVPLKYHIIESF